MISLQEIKKLETAWRHMPRARQHKTVNDRYLKNSLEVKPHQSSGNLN